MLILQYFYWHYLVAPKNLLGIWRNFLIFFWHFFSIGLLVRTLFFPWKRIILVKRRPGFDIKEFAERVFANLVSRFFGFIFRSTVIFLGLLTEITVLFLGPVVLLIWVCLPLILVAILLFSFWGMVIGLILILLLAHLFFQYYLKERPHLLFRSIKSLKIQGENLAGWLDYQSAKIIHQALKQSSTKKQIEKLFQAVLRTEEVKKIFQRLGIEKSKVSAGSIIDLTELLKTALISAQNKRRLKIKPGDLLYALVVLEPNFIQQLCQEAGLARDVEPEDILNVSAWIELELDTQEKKRRFWTLEHLLRMPGLAKDWAYGYTNTLDKFSYDLTEQVKNQDRGWQIFIHQKTIERIEQILARARENNTLLIGQAGVGKKEAILGFAQLIAQGKVLSVLEYKRVVELDLNLLLAGIQSPGELRYRVLRVFNEAEKAGNIIMVIDNFHNLVLNQVAKINLAEIILPYLGSKQFQIIGLTDYENYHKYIEPNSTLLKLFEKVEIPEADSAQTLLILENIVPSIEKRAGVWVTYQALKEIVNQTDLYIQAVPFPEKAIDFLDELAVYVITKTQDKVVLPQHVHQLIALKTGIPVGKISRQAKEALINLEERIHQAIINQDEAVKVVADALRRARTGLTRKKHPIGCFLFLGPTGVGKTSLARVLSQIYFGSEKRMIRLDMSEFKEDSSIANLIGSYQPEKPGILTSAVREKPYTLVLLDEIEKASKSILNLFLEMFDEGRMRDAFGRTVSFRNTIIIATSNAGAELIRASIKQGRVLSQVKGQILDYLQSQGIFRPEFLNRFDAVVLFKPLTEENLLEIAQLMLDQLNKRLKKEQGLSLVVTPELKKKIVELGYEPAYGARPMRRVIQDKIESQIAKKILRGEVTKGEKIKIKPEELVSA
jgi:ATP-dependent Clp protease ATP-binding subunit ClpC